MNFLQNSYGVLLKPSITFRSMVANYSPSLFLQGIIAFFIAHIISSGMTALNIFGSFFSWLILSSLIFIAAYIFILAAHEYWKVLAILAFTNLPMIFTAPLNIFAEAQPGLSFVFKLIISLWVFNLNIIAVSSLCNISKTRALLLYLVIPIAFALILTSLAAKLISNISIII